MLTSPVGIGTLVTSKFFGSETFQKNLTREEKTRKEASDEKKVAEDPKIKPTAEKPTQPTTPATDISPQPAKGNNPVTINITIGKQIEKLVLNTTHLREGVDEIEKQIVKVMLNAVNQSQMIAHI
jgi:hypothetical protein